MGAAQKPSPADFPDLPLLPDPPKRSLLKKRIRTADEATQDRIGTDKETGSRTEPELWPWEADKQLQEARKSAGTKTAAVETDPEAARPGMPVQDKEVQARAQNELHAAPMSGGQVQPDAGAEALSDACQEAEAAQDRATPAGGTDTESQAAPCDELRDAVRDEDLAEEAATNGQEIAPATPDAPQEPAPENEPSAQKADHTGKLRTMLPGVGRAARICLVGLKIFSIVLLSLLVLLLGTLIFVQLNADRLTSYALDQIAQKTDMEMRIGSTDLALFPLPALQLNDIVVEPTKETRFRARTIFVAPNFLALFRGEFEPERITLVEPDFQGYIPEDLSTLTGPLLAADTAGKQTGQTDLAGLLPLHCVLRVENGSAHVRDAQGSRLQLQGLGLEASITNLPLRTPLNGLRGSLSLASLEVQTKDFAARSADVLLEGKTSLSRPLHDLTTRLQGRFAISPLQFAAALDLQVQGGDEGMEGEGIVRGSFVLDGCTIPYALEGRISPDEPRLSRSILASLVPQERKDATRHSVQVRTLALADNVFDFDGVLFADPANPGLAGRLHIDKVSLTRWLGFARGLSPGLQLALDNITNGHIHFYLDSRTLVAPEVVATAAQATFKGRGGVEDWRNINIFLDMTSDFVDLGVAIPEAVGNMQPAPDFGHKPLTSLSREDFFPSRTGEAAATTSAQTAQDNPPAQDSQKARAGSPKQARPESQAKGRTVDQKDARTDARTDGEDEGLSIDYDIRLAARNIHYGYVDLEDGGVVIHPGTNSKGESSACIDMQATIYGGKCTGFAHFSGEEETEYEFKVGVDGGSLAGLHKAMPFIPLIRGTAGCDVQVTSKGSEIDDFLANLDGTIKAWSTNTLLLNDPDLLALFRMDATLRLNRAAFRNNALGLSGSWSFALKGNRGWSGSFSLPGMIWFGGQGQNSGVVLTNLPLKLSVANLERMFTNLRGTEVTFAARGRSFVDTSKMLVRLEGGTVDLPGLNVAGDTRVQLEKNGPRINVQASQARLDNQAFFRALLGKTPDLPQMARNLTLSNTKADIRGKTIRLESFFTTLAQTPVSGSLTISLEKAVPALTMDVRAGSLDLDKFLEKKPAGGQSGQAGQRGQSADTQGAQPAPKDLDFTAFREFDATGQIRLDTLRVKKVSLRNLVLPFSLHRGRLTVPKVRGTLYGGSLEGQGTVHFDRGLSFATDLKVRQFEVGALLREREVKGEFVGKSDFVATLSSSMRTSGQLTSNLNGRLVFRGDRASFRSEDDIKAGKEPMLFASSRCTADISNGVLRTSDFALIGPSLTLTGRGWVDLNRENMDLHFVADMPGLPNVPLRVHGTFDNPKRDIQGGMVILNALGGLAKGIFNLIGGLLGGIVGIFN